MMSVANAAAQFGLGVVLATGVVSPGAAALAADGIYTRVAEAAKVGSSGVVPGCAGRLFETFADAVDAKGWSYGLQLVCAT